MFLYKVVASETDYDQFSEAVVYAVSANDAKEIVRATCADSDLRPADSGAWFPILDTAALKATRVSVRRGPVMGHGQAG